MDLFNVGSWVLGVVRSWFFNVGTVVKATCQIHSEHMVYIFSVSSGYLGNKSIKDLGLDGPSLIILGLTHSRIGY